MEHFRWARVSGVMVVVTALGVSALGAAEGKPHRAVLRNSSDIEQSRFAAQVPGFGGLFYDKDGVANVYAVDPSRAGLFAASGAKVLPGRYDFRELADWREKLNGLLSREDVVMVDVDEATNRVRVALDKTKTDAVSRLGFEIDLAARGVPREAVIVDTMDPIFAAATLRDRFRPVPAGVQIAFGGFVCTLGFNVTRGGVAGFVTNSHCTNTQGGTEGTIHYQNTNTAANRIAVENSDPAYFTGGACPAGRRCRYSDTSFSRYDNAADRQLGRIARPTATGSLTVSTTAPTFTITGTANFPSAGQTLNKVGRTTGWSRGTVAYTCSNINVSGTTITLLCQDGVNAAVLGGDSGSPVFSASTSSTSTSATLYGILWGGNTAGTQFAMSAWENVVAEMGALTVR